MEQRWQRTLTNRYQSTQCLNILIWVWVRWLYDFAYEEKYNKDTGKDSIY